MKNCNFLFKVILLVVCFSMSLLTVAQVRIGGETLPEEGATLDLNPVSSGDYRGGLLLPNVEILNLDFIPISFTDAASMAGYDAIDGVDENVALTGMMVYHVPGSGNSIAEGVYVWVGSEWLPITRSISCKAPNITVPSAAQTISVYMGTAVELSVTATGNNLTYHWYKNNSAISGATSANYNAISSAVNKTANT